MRRSVRDLLHDIVAGAIWIAVFFALAFVTGLRAAEAPPAEPEMPAAAEDVAVRAGTHPGFGRLVFDWPSPIEFDRQESEGRLTLRFTRPMRADLEPARRHLGEYLADVRQDENGRMVHLRLGPDVRVRIATFEPHLVVLDFSRAEPAPAGVAVRTGEHEGFTRVVFEWARPVAFHELRQGRRLTIRFDQAARINAAKLGQLLRAVAEDASASREAAASAFTIMLKPGVEARLQGIGKTRVVLDLLRAEGARPQVEDENASPLAEATPPTTSSENARPRSVSQGVAANEAAMREPDGAVLGELTFAWYRPVAAAVFLRAGYLWVAFDAPPEAATAPLPPPVGPGLEPYLAPGELVDAPDATLVRYPLRRPVPMRVRHDQGTWRVLAIERPSAPEPLPAARIGSPPRLRLEAGAAGRLIEALDPEVGDQLGIWPIRPAGRGQPDARRLVALELLPTLQGLVWRALSDRVQVRAVEGGIEFQAGEELLLSDLAPEDGAGTGTRDEVAPSEVGARPPEAPALTADTVPDRASTPAGSPAQRWLPPNDDETGSAGRASPDLAADVAVASDPASLPEEARSAGLGLGAWSLGPDEGLPERRTALMERVRSAPPEARAEAELNLARFFLAQAMAAETLAVLRGMPKDGDAAEAAPLQVARQGLTGAAELLMGRLRQAADALKHPALDHDAELALWRAALAAAENDWARAARELGRSEQTLEGYPAALQLRLGLPAALIALEAGDPELAFSILARLGAIDAHPADRVRIAFVEGLAHARTGAIDRADRIWQALEGSPYEETRVKAGYVRATMLLDAGRIDPAEALGELEPARALWRGHSWEPAMLDALARVQAAANDVAGALRTWQDTLSRYPQAAEAEPMALAMRQTFVDALLAENGVEVPPLRALALYRGHPELVPEGAEGDRLRRQLAARLAALELVEPAAALLGELLGDRLQGLDKPAAGADLAEVWLRAPRPQAALAALEQSQIPQQLSPELESRRALLRARALATLDRSAEALELIARRDDVAARRLRTAIHWQNRDWPDLIRAIEPQLVGREPGRARGEEEQALVLQLAIAHDRLGHAEALQRLRARFGAAMRGRVEHAFQVATMGGQSPREPEAVLAAASRSIGAMRRLLDHSALPAGR